MNIYTNNEANKMVTWADLNKGLTDGESTNVSTGLVFGTYTRRGDAGFWTNLQHPEGGFNVALHDLRKALASR